MQCHKTDSSLTMIIMVTVSRLLIHQMMMTMMTQHCILRPSHMRKSNLLSYSSIVQ